MASIPPNVHVSRHPCLRAKISQLRSKATTARETKQLVHEISLILGIEALAELQTSVIGTVSLLNDMAVTAS
jgi:uracil phosphoribosyltransferase